MSDAVSRKLEEASQFPHYSVLSLLLNFREIILCRQKMLLLELTKLLKLTTFLLQAQSNLPRNCWNILINDCYRVTIICFIIKNPPKLHSTSKIQPTTSPTFVFSVSANVRKKWGYERKLLTVVLVVVHRVFCSHFIISLKRYDMVATTFST
jgi:hypothetical protein